MKDLASTQIVALREDDARTFLGRRPSATLPLAKELLDEAIAQLKKQRSDELDHQQGSWSVRDEQILGSLNRIRDAPKSAMLKPYLVRALMGFEGTGSFFAYDCGATIEIGHGSLGRSNPLPSRQAVIVFLSHRPSGAHATIAVAE